MFFSCDMGRQIAVVAGFVVAMIVMASPAAYAQPDGVSVDAVRILKTTPDFVNVELSGSNDGSLGPLCFGIIAKSTDGIVRSSGYPPALMPSNGKFRVLAKVLRPSGLPRQETDLLLVMIYYCGHDIVQRRRFVWHYTWPEKKPGPSGDNGNAVELGMAHPWEVFYENLGEEDFAALDAVMQKWNNPEERDQNGEWKLDSFRSVFVNYSKTGRDWKGDLQRLKKWRAANPRSAGAAIAEAKYWVAYAWRIRGNAYQTDPFALRVFRERMQRAEQVLKDSKSYASGNPLWYEAYLDIAVTTRRNKKFIGTLFNDAVRKFPYFQPLYLDMAKYWASRLTDNPDWKKADDVIRRAAANTAKIDGSSDYAMLYSQLGGLQSCECNLFDESRISWEKMRSSFKDLVKRYPSTGNLNRFAAFACRANDKRAFLDIAPRIVDHIIPGKWLTGYSYDACRHQFMQQS